MINMIKKKRIAVKYPVPNRGTGKTFTKSIKLLVIGEDRKNTTRYCLLAIKAYLSNHKDKKVFVIADDNSWYTYEKKYRTSKRVNIEPDFITVNSRKEVRTVRNSIGFRGAAAFENGLLIIDSQNVKDAEKVKLMTAAAHKNISVIITAERLSELPVIGLSLSSGIMLFHSSRYGLFNSTNTMFFCDRYPIGELIRLAFFCHPHAENYNNGIYVDLEQQKIHCSQKAFCQGVRDYAHETIKPVTIDGIKAYAEKILELTKYAKY